MLICKNCGAKLADQSKKCYNCGTPVTKDSVTYEDPFAREEPPMERTPSQSQAQDPAPFDPTDFWGNLDRDQGKTYKAPTDEMLYIGDGADRYAERFRELREKGKIFSWNWGAFLCGPAWFAYRKMYLYAILLLGGNILISLLPAYFFIALIVDVLFGLLGDSIYMNHIDRLVRQGKDLDMTDRADLIRRRGGTTLWGMVIIFLVYEIVVLLLPL